MADLSSCLLLAKGRAGDDPPTVKKVEMGKDKNVILEIEGDKRRVVVKAKVCLREGFLEELMTRKSIKSHEAILNTDADARDIHLALLAAKAEAGHPVKFAPKFETATGTPIKIFIEYQEKGKTVRVSARKWILNGKTKGDLDSDWVFAAASFIPIPTTRKTAVLRRTTTATWSALQTWKRPCWICRCPAPAPGGEVLRSPHRSHSARGHAGAGDFRTRARKESCNPCAEEEIVSSEPRP